MLLLAHSNLRQAVALMAAALVPLAISGQRELKREGAGWSCTFTRTVPAQAKLHIEGHGPVALEAGVSNNIQFTVKVTVVAANEAEAKRILDRLVPRVVVDRGMTHLIAPGGRVLSTVSVKAPHLVAAMVSTTEGGVDARGIDGTLNVEAVGEVNVDRIRSEEHTSEPQ